MEAGFRERLETLVGRGAIVSPDTKMLMVVLGSLMAVAFFGAVIYSYGKNKQKQKKTNNCGKPSPYPPSPPTPQPSFWDSLV